MCVPLPSADRKRANERVPTETFGQRQATHIVGGHRKGWIDIMRTTCLSLLLGLTSLPLHAGTIHQVFNETYAQSSALATIDPVTPPLVDESYLVTVYEDMTGDWVSQTSTRGARISAGRTTWEPNSWEMATPRLPAPKTSIAIANRKS
jgi:hypothetical protein